MKNNWPTKRLGDLCNVMIGGTPRRGVGRYWEGGNLPWVSIADLSAAKRVITDTKERITDIGVSESNVKLIPRGTLLFSFKLSIGKLAFTGSDLYTNEAIAGLIIKSDKELNKNFLYYFLQQATFDTAQKAVKGNTLNKAKIQNLEIPLPPLEIQKKIVKKIEVLFAKIDQAQSLRETSVQNVDDLIPSTLCEIFDSAKSNGWQESKLGDVFVLNYGKGLPRMERSGDGKFIVYGANGELGRSNKYLIEGEGIIIGRKGSAGEVTRVSGKYWPTDVTYFVIENNKYNIDFSYYLFKYLNFPQHARGVKPGINRNDIYNLKIHLPPIAEQRKIVARMDALTQKVRELRKFQSETAANLTALKQSILHRAFQGNV